MNLSGLLALIITIMWLVLPLLRFVGRFAARRARGGEQPTDASAATTDAAAARHERERMRPGRPGVVPHRAHPVDRRAEARRRLFQVENEQAPLEPQEVDPSFAALARVFGIKVEPGPRPTAAPRSAVTPHAPTPTRATQGPHPPVSRYSTPVPADTRAANLSVPSAAPQTSAATVQPEMSAALLPPSTSEPPGAQLERRLSRLRPLQRAVVHAEVFGKPAALQPPREW